VVIPALALGWLVWRTLDQDRLLERHRAQERLQQSAELMAAALQERLRTLPAEAAKLDDSRLSDDAAVLTIKGGIVGQYPSGRLLYLPSVPATSGLPAGIFNDAETLEFHKKDWPSAALVYRKTAASQNGFVRAAALVALARVSHKAGRQEDVKEALSELESLDGATVDGVPAAIIAQHERCSFLAELHSTMLAKEASRFYSTLTSGRWPIDRGMWEFYSEAVRNWMSPATPAAPVTRLVLSEAAAEALRIAQNSEPGSGVRGIGIQNCPLLLAWHRNSDRTTLLIAGRNWLTGWLRFGNNFGLNTALIDDSGHLVAGRSPAPGALSATPSIRGSLPWTLTVSSDPGTENSSHATRRLVLLGFGCAAVLLLTGGYLVTRALARELAVAHLQSDFVSAVSHEFRTPLTTMRHLTGLLEEGAVKSDARRLEYYAVLSRETARLHRLVESLLDFRKMEAGKAQYHFAACDVAGFTECVAEEFRNALDDPERLSVDPVRQDTFIRADREALSRALHNLLENAAKYSPPASPIRLRSLREGNEVKIVVEDEGQGIPEQEQQEIFKPFYRGAASRQSAVKGTGIGLATVRQIVSAHGGRILLDSKSGAGSRFEIVLPLDERRKV
jgi:signal transduction histidine kinase